MSDKRYLGNIITDSPTEPSSDLANSSAKGVWSLEEQLAYQKAGLWPVPGNFTIDIDDVFSTYLYEGTGSAQTIANGIDLAGEGGLVWIKKRSGSANHYLSTNETGGGWLYSNQTNGIVSSGNTTTFEFQSNGFINAATGTNTNGSGEDYASWTFRKAPKFFDIVTYTGTGSAQTIAHNLGSVPGMIIVKDLDRATNWAVYHRGSDPSAPEDYGLLLSQSLSRDNSIGFWNDTAPTSTHFTVGDGGEVGGNSGDNLVAYLFAHNNNDGGFGPDSDQDIIKCGSYTGNGSNTGPIIDLGFEPQWLMIKGSSIAKEWRILDVMRGMPVDGSGAFLEANSNIAEGTDTGPVALSANGFQLTQGGSETNNNGDTYIYMAIRRGPLAVPEDATDVFNVATRTAVEPAYVSGFPVDMALRVNGKQSNHNTNIGTRITGIFFALTDSTYQFQDGNEYEWDYMNGWNSNASNDTNSISWMWKRAPSYFDVVCWKTENTANRRLKHSLGVAPEMVWIKNRATEQWYVYQSDLGSNIQLRLDTADDVVTTSALWPSPSATEFGIRENAIWNTGTSLVGYFFATVNGISKVGSYTGNGSSQTIDCGFTSGSRFILIKRTDANGNWVFFDSVRGIVSGISPSLFLNDVEGERTSEDVIDPASSGFTVNQETQQNLNVNGGNYIFYAIA